MPTSNLTCVLQLTIIHYSSSLTVLQSTGWNNGSRGSGARLLSGPGGRGLVTELTQLYSEEASLGKGAGYWARDGLALVQCGCNTCSGLKRNPTVAHNTHSKQCSITVKPVYNGHCISRSPLYNSQVTESQMGLQCAFQPALTGHLSITASFWVPRVTTIDRFHCIIIFIGSAWTL